MSVRVLGIINATPDSFSDGNRFNAVEDAVARAEELTRLGAHVIDVGGESTRPGAVEVGTAEEQRRTIPIIRELSSRGITVSVDTIRAATAEAAVLAGARYVNDVSGGTYDSAMLDTVARLTANIDGVHYIVGHWRGIPDPGHGRSHYGDIVHEVATELTRLVRLASEAGIPESNIIVDPGLGFDKTPDQCWEILRRIDEIHALGYPILIGASRKRMLADICASTAPATEGSEHFDVPLATRDLATSVVSALCARAGVWGVRVHEVQGTVQALNVEAAWGSAPSKPAQGSPVPTKLPITPANRYATITLTGLEVFAYHGVYEFERASGQQFIIDVSVQVDVAATADDIGATVHYGELAEAIGQGVAENPVDLIETVADRVANIALSYPAVTQTTVTVHKPEAPITVPFSDVSVTVTRERTA